MKDFFQKLREWSLSSIVGNVVWLILTTVIFSLIGYFTNSFDTVMRFAESNACEAVIWSGAFLLIGASIGFVIRHRIALKNDTAKDRQIKELTEKTAIIDDISNEKERLKKELKKERASGEIEQFSPRQLDLMTRICDTEGKCERFLMDNGSNEMQDAIVLERYGVITIEDASMSSAQLSLEMNWRKFVKRRRDDIDEYTKDARAVRERRERARRLSQNAIRIQHDPSYLLFILSSKGVMALDALIHCKKNLSPEEEDGCGELCDVEAAIYDEDPITGISHGYILSSNIENYFSSQEGANELDWKLEEIQRYRQIDGE